MTRTFPRATVLALVLALGAGALQGCIVLAGGAALGGAVVVTDRRSVGIQIEDTSIEHRINSSLDARFSRESVRIDVNSFNQRVLLTGQVPTDRDRQDAERIARDSQNVHEVINELGIGSLAGLINSTDDLLLAGKVRAEILGTKGIPSSVVKVTVFQGNVYLMGRVGSEEAELAKRVASHVNGVKRVVVLFEMLTDAEVERLRHGETLATPPPSPPAPVVTRP